MSSGAFDNVTHYPLVHVVWVDHWSEDAWIDIDDLVNKPALTDIHTVGWLLKEDDDRYLITGVIGDDKTCCCSICILKGNVKKFEVLANGRDHITHSGQ